MSFSITKTNLLTDYNVPKLSDDSWKHITIQACDENKEFVNTILENETIEYIITGNGERILLDSDTTSFQINGISVTDMKGDTKFFPLFENSNFSCDMEEIEINGNIYPCKSYDFCKAIITAKKEDISKMKPWQGKYFKKARVEYREYLKETNMIDIYKNARAEKMSLLELTSLKEFNSKERLDFLVKYFSDIFPDTNIPEFIDHIDDLFDFAKKKFKERTWPLKNHKVFKAIDKNCKIKSPQDIENFLEQASNSKWNMVNTTIYCTLLKYMYLYNEMKKTPLFVFIEQIEEGQIDVLDMIRDIFSLQKNTKITKNSKGIYQFNKSIEWVKAIVTFRIKSVTSIIKKALAKWEYMKIENFYDIFWTSIYIPEKDEKRLANIMMTIDRTYFDGGSGYIKNRWTLQEQHVQWFSNTHNLERKYLKAVGTNKRHKWTSSNYGDVRIIWKWTLEKKPWRESIKDKNGITIGMEFKFLLGKPEESTNETGMSFHPIYEYFWKFFEWEKNRTPFTKRKTIEAHINNLYDILIDSDFLEKHGKTKTEIFQEIYKDLYDKNLSKKDINNNTKLKNIYFSKIAPWIFKYLHKVYNFQVSSLNKETILISEDNYQQLQDGGRWYTLSK